MSNVVNTIMIRTIILVMLKGQYVLNLAFVFVMKVGSYYTLKLLTRATEVSSAYTGKPMGVLSYLEQNCNYMIYLCAICDDI